MSFSPMSSLIGSSHFPAPPSCKRRKLSSFDTDFVQEKIGKKRLPNAPDGNGVPLKRRKIEIQTSSSKCEIQPDSPDCEMRDVPPIQPVNQNFQNTRFTPRMIGEERLTHLNLDTPYKKHLAAVLFNSVNPNEEKILHYSSSKAKQKHPYNPSIHNPSLDSIKHPTFSVEKIIDAPDLLNDFYRQSLAYNQNQDCIAIILNCSIFLKKGDEILELPFNSSCRPTSLAFNPEGNAILVSMNDGHLFAYALHFDQDKIIGEPTWESGAISTPGSMQTNQLLVSDSYIFIGMADGRICRISRSDSTEFKFYNNIENNRITGLALTPDGKSLLVSDATGTATLFDVDSLNPLHQIQACKTTVKALAFSPCGRFFVAGGGFSDPQVTLFSIENGQMQKIVSHYIGSQTTALFWHDDLVISTHRNGTVCTFSFNPNHLFHLSPPKHNKIPFIEDRSLIFAALKRGRAFDTLLAASPDAKVLFEIKIQRPKQKEEETFKSSTSMYNTIR